MFFQSIPNDACAVKISNSEILILGGKDNSDVYSNEILKFDINTLTWTSYTAPGLIKARGSFGCTLYNNDIIIAGGDQENNDGPDNTNSYDNGYYTDTTEIIPLSTLTPRHG